MQSGAEFKGKNLDYAYRLLFKNMAAGSCIDELVYEDDKTVDYIILDVNPAYERIMGIDRKEAVGSLGSKLYKLGKAPFMEEFQHVCDTGEPLSFEAFFPPAGKELRFSVFKVAERTVSTQFHDITTEKATEQPLLDELAERRILLDNIPTQVWYLMDEETYGAVNKAHADFNGTSVEEISFRKLHDIFPKDSAEKCRAGNAEVFRTGKATLTEEWVPHVSGKRRLISVNRVPKLRDDGTVKYVVCSAEDITEQRQTRDKAVILAELLDTAPESITVHDKEGRFLYANKKTFELHGLEEEDFYRLNLKQLDVPESAALIDERVRQIAEKGEAVFEVSHYRKDGTSFPLEVTAKIAEWEGKPVIISVGKDITERKLAEKAGSESAERYRTLLNTSMDGFFLADIDGRLLEVNDTYCGMTGYSREEILELRIYELDAFETRDDMALRMKHIMEKGEARFETRHRRKDGAEFDAEVSVQYRPLEGGYVAAFIRDVTLKKKQSEELELKSMVLDQIQDHVTITDLKGVITYVNNAQIDKLGYSREEFTGRNVEMLGEDTQRGAAQKEIIEKTLLQGEWRGEVVNFSKDGKEIIMDCRTGLVRDATGTPKAMCGIATDVTEHKRMIESLRESEKILNRSQEIAGLGSFVWDLRDDTLRWSSNMYEVHGLKRNALTGTLQETISQIIHPEDRDRVRSEIESMVAVGEVKSMQFRILLPDGQERIIESSGEFELDERGRPVRCLGIHQDITERKQREEEMNHFHELMRYIIEHNRSAIAVHDRDLKYVYVSRRYLDEYNVKEADVIGKYHYEVFPDLPQKWRDIHQRALAGEVLSAEDDPYERADGTIDWTRWECRPWYAADGSIGGIIIYTEVITERKRAEEERKRLELQLIQAQKMESVGRLAGGVAHDFNNMLGVILGNAEMALLEADLDNPIREHLVTIQRAANRSANLTRQLLAFARKQTAVPRVIDLNDCIDGMLRMIGRLIGENIALAWMPCVDVWPVFMDPAQMDQILANLCVNARDAIRGKGRIAIRTEKVTLDNRYALLHPGANAGDYVMLSVSDTGSGMDSDTLANIFEPFFTTKEMGKGTGLGLATVYGIVKQNNGWIDVESTPGVGTTFMIYMPRHTGERAEQRVQSSSEPDRGRGETVLLVEDEEMLLKMGKMLLTRLGYRVFASASPSEAISIAGENRIELLITDLVMPEMDGKELASKILSFSPQTRCIYTSGYTADIISVREILDQGLNFMEKPFDSRKLAKMAREVLDR